MKRILLVAVVIAGMVIAGTIIAGIGGDMRTPITKPGFDNIPTLIDMDSTSLEIVDSNAEEDFYVVTIPRNSLGLTDRAIHVDLEYTAQNNSGGPIEIVYRVYYGTSLAVTTPADVWASNASYRFGHLTIWLVNSGAIDAQHLTVRDDGNLFIGAANVLAQESNKELDLTVTIQFDTAHASVFIGRLMATTTQMAP